MASKIFEVNDVLPATTQLRISWSGSDLNNCFPFRVETDDGNFIFVYNDDLYVFVDGITVFYYNEAAWIFPYNNTNHAYVDINTSTWDESKRTISIYDTGSWTNVHLYWEDLAPVPTGFNITYEENGGSTVTDLTEQTELPTPLPTTTKSGYKFVAWYYESNFQTRAKAGDTIEANTTLYAKWHNLGSLFTEIADAIRSKDGTSENIRDVDFGERVKQIQGAKELTQAQYDALGTKDSNTYYLIDRGVLIWL